MMADLYHAPEIKKHYCRDECILGSDTPKIVADDLDRITIKAIVSLKRATETKDLLLDITEDGIISEDERPALEQILKNLDEVSTIAQSLKIWAEKNLR